MAGNSAERATERVVVLMTPAEKAVYVDRVSGIGLSLGQFFPEAGAAYVSRDSGDQGRQEALDAALSAVERMNDKVEEMAGLMREQQRRIDDLNGRLIRAETMLELLVHRAVASSGPALESGSSGSR